jgi:fructan beta-fructosidase
MSGGTPAEVNAWLRENKLTSGPLELNLALEVGNDGKAGVRLYAGEGQETLITVDRAAGVVSIDRTKSGQTAFHPKFAGIHQAPLDFDERV